MMFRIGTSLIFVVMFSPRAASQELSQGEQNARSLTGRHIIAVNAGLLGGTVAANVAPGDVSAETSTSGAVGFVGYEYGVRADLTLGVTVGVLDSGVSASVERGEVESESSVVAPILFGVTYYPAALAISRKVCPFVSLAAGPYVGSATNTIVGSTVASRTVSDTAVGSRLVGGIDWFISQRFKLGAEAGYHFVGDFDERIGRHDNYSGPEFSLGLGVMLGG